MWRPWCGGRSRSGRGTCSASCPVSARSPRVAGQLAGVDAEVLQVHGRAPAAVQDAVLAGSSGGRRVILATSVAESSLTVPGVRVVVDSRPRPGAAHRPRAGPGRPTTVRASRAAGRQRAGRAGREAPGAVYRCWEQAEDGRARARSRPRRSRWPTSRRSRCRRRAGATRTPPALALLDPPPAGAMGAAREVLDGHRRGGRGRAGSTDTAAYGCPGSGCTPGWPAPCWTARRRSGRAAAAEVVALLSEEPPREYGDDLAAAALRTARRGAGRVRGAVAAGGAAAVAVPGWAAPGRRVRARRTPPWG